MKKKYRILVNEFETFKVQVSFLGIWFDMRHLCHPNHASILTTFKSRVAAKNHVEGLKAKRVPPAWKIIETL